MNRTPPLPLEEAQARLIALAPTLPLQNIAVSQALGFYLAEPVAALRTQPAAPMSAMDGFAVLGTQTSGPWRVIGESAAGHPFTGRVLPSEAVRISTGAIMPDDTDSVILQEDVSRHDDHIELEIGNRISPGKHVRGRGMDFTAGDTVMLPGMKIGPAQIALALASGHAKLPVRRKPRLTIVDSGDELSAPGGAMHRHQIPASNAAMLAAMIAPQPCEITLPPPMPDRLDAIGAMLDAAEDCDVIVTSGGASVGDHDLIRPALERWGASIEFWRVAIKPGKPLLVASRDHAGRRQLVIGLPGNPVSSHVTAFFFLLPLVRAMLGAATPLPGTMASRLGAAIGSGGARREFLRASWNGDTVTPHPLQDSGALSPLAASNVLIDRPAHAPASDVGDVVTCYLLHNGGNA